MFYVTGQHGYLFKPFPEHDPHKLIRCVTNILDKYFAHKKELTFVNMNSDENESLKEIHSTMRFSLITRNATEAVLIPNVGYVVYSPDVDTFSSLFQDLTREPPWNPYARFLIVIELLLETELRQVFDVLLRQHVNDALLVNGTEETHLYTYNPFDNYACGRYYDTVIKYGLCAETRQNLYPNKLVNGLKNCTFRASYAHIPPYSIEPSLNEYPNKLLGLEQYVLKTVSESDEFKIDFNIHYNSSIYSRVSPNMTATGPIAMLQTNKTDVMIGSLMLRNSYQVAFTSISGYNDYVDEFTFAVRKASYVPSWKYFYLEFNVFVWLILLVCIIVYSTTIIFLLRPTDKGRIILELVGNLLLQGRGISGPMTIKYVVIIWVWFAYIVNIFYQSSLVSLTTNPSKEYQISNEEDIAKYNLRPCLSELLANNIYTDTASKEQYEKIKVRNVHCEHMVGALELVSKNKDMFTIFVSYFYLYNKDTFNDQYGEPLIHYIERPFLKLLCGMQFYKGFPISARFQLNMMRMRESGLVQKNVRDQYYMRSLKYRFSSKEFVYRFVSPWIVYFSGCILAAACFFIEVIIKIKQN